MMSLEREVCQLLTARSLRKQEFAKYKFVIYNYFFVGIEVIAYETVYEIQTTKAPY